MKAIAVIPGKPGSVHLAELPKPDINEIPNGRGVLVKVLRVGVDGTDKEINAAEYGASPAGCDFLVIGHESFGIVEKVGKNVTEFVPGDYVTATVRRPGRKYLRQDRQVRYDDRRHVLRARHQPAPRLSHGVLCRGSRIPCKGPERVKRIRRAA